MTHPSLTPRCAECTAPLAHDQRYCVECGARRGGLPEAIAQRIHAILARGDVEALGPAAAQPAGAVGGASASTVKSGSMPSPRAAAVAILGMLAAGVVVGSVASTNAESLQTPLVLAVAPPVSTPGSAPPAVVPPAPAPAAPSVSAPAPATSASSSSGTSSGSSGSGNGGSSSSSTPSVLPPVKHVFLIMLSTARYDQSFGAPASDPYLAKTLRKQGELFPNYYAVAQGDLANEIALLSGQGPTPQTAANCPTYSALTPGVFGAQGQVHGSGCVYPAKALTLADELTTAGRTWKAYVEGIGNAHHGQAKTCRHPTLGSADPGAPASLHDPYVTWNNPFVYFKSIGKAACAKDDVGMSRLATDLKSANTTPAFSYIVPSPCDDGNSQPCFPGAQSGLAAADRFLRGVVQEIEASPAYTAGGLIAITFDQAPQSGPYADASSCCNSPVQYPNLPTTTTPTTTTPAPTTTTPATTTPATTTPATTTTTPTTTVGYPVPPTTTTTPATTTPATTTPAAATTPTTPTATTPASEQTGQTSPTGGGGEVGLLVISKYVKANSTDTLDYFNHYSLLSSIEKLFGLRHLGYARDPALTSLGKPQYNNYP